MDARVRRRNRNHGSRASFVAHGNAEEMLDAVGRALAGGVPARITKNEFPVDGNRRIESIANVAGGGNLGSVGLTTQSRPAGSRGESPLARC